MMRKLFCTTFLLLILASGAIAQETIKTLSLSNDFSTIPGTPRVTRNGFKHLWLVAWRQNGNPARIMGRLIQSNGNAGPAKAMASGATAFEQNFDISYDSVSYTYLLAYETAQGLQTQFFNQNFVKSGPPSLIEGGVTNSQPRLAFDPSNQKFLIFWASTQDGVQRRVLKSRVLEKNGKPAADARTLSTAGAGKSWGFSSVSTNPKNGNLLLMVLEKSGNNGAVVGFTVKPDGSLLRPVSSKFQPSTAGLNTAPDAHFLDAGTGFAIWSDKTAIKYRKVSLTGTFAGGMKSVANAADANSVATTIMLDSRNNQFVGIWTDSNEVRANAFNSVTGAIIKQPFTVATSLLTNSRNAASSYDAQQGNVLVVWEDSNVPGSTVTGSDARFRTRAAIFFIGGAASQKTVTIGDNFFSPAQLTVSAGSTVRWNQGGSNPHTVTNSGGGGTGSVFDSPNLGRGDSFEFRFTAAGRYEYFCRIHGQTMSGTITVTADQEPPPRY